jgi:tRNA A37 threonylcarbamoyladenosine dehydratase
LQTIPWDSCSSDLPGKDVIKLFLREGSKVDVAAARVKDINPDCLVSPMNLFVHNDTIDKLTAQPLAQIIDAIDSLNPKIELLTFAYNSKIPIISSMGAALRTDPSKIKSGDIFGLILANMAYKKLLTSDFSS